MTLARRIIPVMLTKGRTLVKGQRFDSWRSVGNVMQAARIHAARGVDELIILDISATAEDRRPDLGLIRELCEDCFIPVTVGGGVRSLADMDALFRAGADKICVCTAAWEVPSLIPDASKHYGKQAIVGVVEYADGDATIRCGSSNLQMTPLGWAGYLEKMGVGEILLSSVERDGVMQGYDLPMIETLCKLASVPVIAAGGCGSYQHMLEAFKAGADACASGAMLAFTDQTPRGAAKFLQQHGMECRI